MSPGAIIALASAGGVSLILAITVIILTLFSKSRTTRADHATDAMIASEHTLLERSRELLEAWGAARESERNNKTLQDALASRDEQIARLERKARSDKEQIDELVEQLGDSASADDVLALLRRAHGGLADDLGRLRAQNGPPGTVSGAPATGGEDHHGDAQGSVRP